MGGPSSGRWRWHWRATTMEQCRQLDFQRLRRAGVFADRPAGTVRWYWGGLESGSAGDQVSVAQDDGLVLSLSHRWMGAGCAAGGPSSPFLSRASSPEWRLGAPGRLTPPTFRYWITAI